MWLLAMLVSFYWRFLPWDRSLTILGYGAGIDQPFVLLEDDGVKAYVDAIPQDDIVEDKVDYEEPKEEAPAAMDAPADDDSMQPE